MRGFDVDMMTNSLMRIAELLSERFDTQTPQQRRASHDLINSIICYCNLYSKGIGRIPPIAELEQLADMLQTGLDAIKPAIDDRDIEFEMAGLNLAYSVIGRLTVMASKLKSSSERPKEAQSKEVPECLGRWYNDAQEGVCATVECSYRQHCREEYGATEAVESLHQSTLVDKPAP